MFTIDHYVKDDGCSLAPFKIIRLIRMQFLARRLSFRMPLRRRKEWRRPEKSPVSVAGHGSVPPTQLQMFGLLWTSSDTEFSRLIPRHPSNFKSPSLTPVLSAAGESVGPHGQFHFRLGELRPEERGATPLLLPAPSFKAG